MNMSTLNAIGVKELETCNIFRRLFAEFIGTFLLTVFLISGIQEIESVIGFAVATGFLLASIIAYIGHISGGHVNPAVTVGMLTCCFIKILPAIFYMIVQILGALLGQLVAEWIHESTKQVTKKDANTTKTIDALPAFGLEVLETFLLVSVVVSVSDPRRYSRGVGSALAIGLSVSAAICAVPNYRCALNPALALASSVYTSSFTNHWVYWAGPLLGGLLAGFVYRYIMTCYPTVRVTRTYRASSA